MLMGNKGFTPKKPPVNIGDELDVKIEAVGTKGDGIARKDGYIIFVPNTQEGQQVHVRVTKVLNKVGFAEVATPGEIAPAKETAAEPEEAPAPEEETAEPEEGEAELPPLPEESEEEGAELPPPPSEKSEESDLPSEEEFGELEAELPEPPVEEKKKKK